MSCECARTRVKGDADANVKTDSNSLVAPGSFAQTYQYYDFPFCRSPEGVKRERTDLGEVLGGDRLAKSPYEIEFGIDKENVDLCTQFLERKEVEKFRRAVKNDYYFQMSFDDLPIWGFIGKVEKIMRGGAAAENRYFLFTHVHFEISYNEDRVIEINLSTDPLKTVDITADEAMSMRFSYISICLCEWWVVML